MMDNSPLCLLSFLSALILFQTDSSSSVVTWCVFDSSEKNKDDVSSCAAAEPCESATLHNLTAGVDEEDEVVVYLCSSSYSLDNSTTINFTDIKDVSIIGQADGSSLDCHGNNTGLYFRNVSTLTVEHITLSHCGLSISEDYNNMTNFITCSIYVEECTHHIFMTYVSILNSSGAGLALVNNSGIITITNSSFHDNGRSSNRNEGGLVIYSTKQYGQYDIRGSYFTSNNYFQGSGLNVQLRGQSRDINISVVNCTFLENTAQRGGAVYIAFLNNSQKITLMINRSIFDSNKAIYGAEDSPVNGGAVNSPIRGGAVYIVLLDNSTEVNLSISQSNFTNNNATYKGGAIQLGYSETPSSRKNIGTMQIITCDFISNTAELGGGLYLYSDSHYLEKSITFVNCSWLGNNASSGGSAIYVVAYDETRNLFLTLMLINCSFERNYNTKHNCIEQKSIGVLKSHAVHIILDETVKFVCNLESAVYMESSILEVKSHANVTFTNNHGEMGGAIRMQDYSTIKMNNNSTFNFTNNSACFYSGAIYYFGKKCFIENISNLIFSNNTVILSNEDNRGVSLFAASLIPCLDGDKTVQDFLISLGLNNMNVSTFPNETKLPENSVIPGKEKDVIFLDETGSEVEEPFVVEISKSKSIVFLDKEYKDLNHRKLKLQGDPGSNATLTLHLKHRVFSLDISLDPCPPGYVLNGKACECSANTKTRFFRIQRCNKTTYQALLVHGFWAGYNVSDQFSDETFRTSRCPLGYCSNESNEITLPDNANSIALNSLVCSDNRYGRVCGKCEENTSVLFHTPGTFNCGMDDHHLCNYGILFYIITEIIPVTFLFVFIILLDVQLTKGALNSFLFYAQIVSVLTINADSYVTFPKGANILLDALNFIISFFNLTFFLHPNLSFCLFKGATFFHVTIFHYMTVAYALLLVVLVIAVLNSRFNKVIFKLVKLRKRNFSKSIIHGLSGFLVICYARYTNASLRILTPVALYGKNAKAKEIVLYYYGEVDFFSPDHLPYAIPAIFILITMTLMPPLLLIFFPLYYKTLSLLKMEEPRFMKLLFKVIPLEKLMPFFDCFQGSFKDKYRYFAGFYFAYRVSALLIFSYAPAVSVFYGLLELQFVLTLAFHAWIQPYKNKWHNRLDIYIFTILCIINGIALSNYEHTLIQLNYQNVIDVLSTLQVLLAYTPLLIMLAYFVFKMRFIVRAKCARNYDYRRERSESDFTLSMIDQSRDIGYEKM